MTQNFVITGASRGIGLEFVRQIASQEGNVVYAGARNPEGSKDLMTLVDNKKVFAFTIDVDSKESIENAVAKVSETATEGIDILINNAGISSGASDADKQNFNVLTSPKSEYVRVFETNVGGVSDVTQAFLPLLRKGGADKFKRIVNITSILASIQNAFALGGGVGANNSAYKVSKTALNMLTELFADALSSESFAVIAIHPGWVQTDMGGKTAHLKPSEAVKYLLTTINKLTKADNGHYLNYNGQTLPW